jgi:hypothetical protein
VRVVLVLPAARRRSNHQALWRVLLVVLNVAILMVTGYLYFCR